MARGGGAYLVRSRSHVREVSEVDRVSQFREVFGGLEAPEAARRLGS